MAVTTEQLIVARVPGSGRRIQAKLAASAKLLRGTLVFLASGYATATAGGAFAGVAVDTVDNTGGGAGALECELYTDMDIELPGSGFTQADVGKLVYASDNYTCTLTAASNSLIGHITRFISATKIEVRLRTGPAT